MPDLIRPTIRLHESWLRSRAEWGAVHQPGSGLRPDDDVESAAGFATWVTRLRSEEDTSLTPVEGLVHCTYRWIVEDDELLGAISLRHTLNDFLFRAGGHIGYGIRPSARRRGLASWALGEMLVEAGKLGIDRVMISCDVTNEASARTIEKHGGVLEDIRDSEIGRVKRFWITL
ncbi:GNAT family N-acetyltransferase [Actinoplanes sp. NPDC023714]|uniref:GNAT family N-acetyltransferase n=1 Tax=Actinoplanes sp. NPDC023714 TaxID=3154322 RepID=UPI0033C7740E